MKIAFIGGGNMAEAMVSGLIKARFSPQNLTVCDISSARCAYLKEKYQLSATQSYKETLNRAEVVVLAIKPKDLPQVMEQIKGLLSPAHLILSIVAGTSLSRLSQGLKHDSVVRVMPNINAQVGGAISLWTAHPGVGSEKKELARSLLSALGMEIYVENEEYLDMATALSGSGPAYVFHFIEALVDAGVYLGLPRELAWELVLQTVLGSAKFLKESRFTPAEAISKVVSPGGTTAEALALLKESGFQGKIIRAVEAAFQKAKKL